MKPYFDTNSAGVLLLIVLVAWLSIEAMQLVRQSRWRAGTTRTGRRSFWIGFAACLIVPDQPVITSGPYRLLRHPRLRPAAC